MEDKNIYQTIGRHLVNNQNKEDKEHLDEWIKEDEDNVPLFKHLTRHWNSPRTDKISIIKSEEVKVDIWNSLNKNNPRFTIRKKSPKRSVFLRYAAVVLLAIGSTLGIYFYSPSDQSEKVTSRLISKSNNQGRKSEIHLKDGSTVYLNSDSKLSYQEIFSDTARIVRLEGEAFFEIAKDVKRPFYVISQNIMIKALGTSFNVSAFSNHEELRVSLATGKVSVSEDISGRFERSKREHILLPGQEIFYQKKTDTFSDVTDYNPDEVYGWKDGLLYFQKAELEEIVLKLERWYGVDIQVVSEPDEKLNYTGTFKSQNLEKVLVSMGFVNNFEFEINNKNVLLNFKKRSL